MDKQQLITARRRAAEARRQWALGNRTVASLLWEQAKQPWKKEKAA
ncbi:hypothetical protein HNR62_000310 [Oceanisphaera litoralis]|nr:hypothetical protein [Oceanisphaera litoralis]MBM7454481.1 hypothetical protein [Oceanisphaera litoralis]